MTPEQEAKMDRLLEQQGKVHYTLFGAEGEGGLVRDVKALKAHREDILAFKAKMLGMVTGLSLIHI